MFALRSITFKQIFKQSCSLETFRASSCGPKLVRHDSVKNILQENNLESNDVIQINGWARKVLKQKLTSFIHLDDGSSVQRLQVVVPNSVLK